jgi:drug/metabolite transporter (DMT)-like permease
MQDDKITPFPSQADKEAAPITALLSSLVNEISTLVRQEIRLAQTEMSEKATQAVRGGIGMAAAGALAFAALIFLLLSATLGLSNAVAPWLAALIVGVVVGGIALILFKTAQSKLKATNLTPDRTIETLKADAAVVRNQVPGER